MTGGESEARIGVELSVVIALYNEEEGVRELLSRLGDALDRIDARSEIVIVDDGSSDGTLALLKSAIASQPRLRVVELATNAGQVNAVSAGLTVARGAWLTVMDGDLQHDPADLPSFWNARAPGVDLVASYRAKRREKLRRRIITWFANRMNRFLTGTTIRDFGSSYRVFSSRLLRSLKDRSGTVHFNAPALFINSRRFVEVPVTQHGRRYGESKWTFFQFLVFNMDFVTASSRPPELLVVVAVITTLVGVALYILGRSEMFGAAQAASAPVQIAMTALLIGLMAIVWRELIKTQRLVIGVAPFEIVAVWSNESMPAGPGPPSG